MEGGSDEQHWEATDSTAFRRVLGHFASGITVVTAALDDHRVGFTCQSFASVSLDPPLVAFFAREDSLSWATIRESGTFAVNVLSRRQEQVARVFGTRGVDKFRDVDVTRSPNGSPLINGVIAWLDCRVENIFQAGDHEGVLGRVDVVAHVHNAPPLLYFRGGYGTFES